MTEGRLQAALSHFRANRATPTGWTDGRPPHELTRAGNDLLVCR
jgi:hypothetical protein